jgi:hypothetical protein
MQKREARWSRARYQTDFSQAVCREQNVKLMRYCKALSLGSPRQDPDPRVVALSMIVLYGVEPRKITRYGETALRNIIFSTHWG